MQGKSLKLKKLKQPAVLSERTSALAINFAYTKVSNNSSKEIASPNICDRPPTPPPSPPPLLAGVIRGAYTCAVQAYLTFFICKLLTFSGLKCAINPYFAQTLLRNAKLARGYQNHRNFVLNTRGALKLSRFSSPDLASLKCYAFLRLTPKRAAAPWDGGKGRITFQTTT